MFSPLASIWWQRRKSQMYIFHLNVILQDNMIISEILKKLTNFLKSDHLVITLD